MRASGLQWMADPEVDGTEFNPYRGVLWATLQREYPVKIDPKAFRGEPLLDTENPSEYVSHQLKRWRPETEEEVHNSPLMTTLFRTSVVEAMPAPVKSRLEDVVGLTSKLHREFCEHVTHAVEKYRRDEQRLKEQHKDIQRKVAQLQLGELMNKNKAAVVEAPVITSTPVPPLPPGHQPLRPQLCWGCGQPGHNKQHRPTRPWPAPEGMKGGYGGWQSQQPSTGPVNEWGGPNHGY